MTENTIIKNFKYCEKLANELGLVINLLSGDCVSNDPTFPFYIYHKGKDMTDLSNALISLPDIQSIQCFLFGYELGKTQPGGDMN